MSLILDALKKLEKDRVARRKRPVRIASDILLSEESVKKRRTTVLMVGLAGIAVAALVLVVVIANPFSERVSVKERETVSAVPRESRESVPASGVAPQQLKSRISSFSSSEVDRKAADTVRKSKSKKSAVASDVSRLPVLTVTGIVWVEDRRTRRAMVNGEVVSEGGRVGGAQVLEIHPDHVLFSHAGNPFSVYLK